MSAPRFRAGKRLWEAGDNALLREIYPDLPTVEVARRLGRSVSAIYGRVAELAVCKSEAYRASPAACRLRRGDHIGAKYRFPKGHVPMNKGTRRPGWGPGRMKDTQFKSGVSSWRTQPVGSTRILGGYVYRKVSAVMCTPGHYVPYTVNWKLEHRLIWEAARGPVPPGRALVFRDGNRQDTRLENLECITRAELMARNTVHNLPKPLVEVIQLIGAVGRQINRRDREKQDRRSA